MVVLMGMFVLQPLARIDFEPVERALSRVDLGRQG